MTTEPQNAAPPESTASLKWRGDIGPSFLLLLGQTIGAIVAVTMIYASLSNTVNNTKETAEKLTAIVDRVTQKNNDLGNRLTAVETSVADIKNGVNKVADKLDNLMARPQPATRHD